MTARRARLIAGFLLVAVVVSALFLVPWKSLYWSITHDKFYEEWPSKNARGWSYLERGAKGEIFERRRGPLVQFSVRTGFKTMECVVEDIVPTRRTYWNEDGTVRYQERWRSDLDHPDGPLLQRRAPPWWWGVTDQSAPTMPEWMKDDARWQAALEKQGK